jgi:hypothetical protein
VCLCLSMRCRLPLHTPPLHHTLKSFVLPA